ncbi:MAG TPA: hypothetical protein VJ183_05935 [Chloroflexia bacterium]|nr:hypothetical protein [Chloroflexia bacterium]
MMVAKSQHKKVSSARALYELLACLVVVMLGGTRVLDYSAYEDTDIMIRSVLIWNANHAGDISLAGDHCVESWIEGQSISPAYPQRYRISTSDDCRVEVSTPFWMTHVYSKMLNTAELAKQLMPLEYRVQEALSIPEQYTTLSTQEPKIVTWQIEVPSPPPRTLATSV